MSMRLKKLQPSVAKLEPKPGRAFLTEDRQQNCLPELAIRKIKEEWKVFLNPLATPHIKISDTYKDMLASADNKNEVELSARKNSIRSIFDSGAGTTSIHPAKK